MNLDCPAQRMPRSSFDTRHLPGQAAVSAWRDSISVLFEARPRKTVDDGFFARIDASLAGEVGIGRLTASAQDFDRSRQKIARDGMDGYLLQFYLSGHSASRTSGEEAMARPGDLYVIDMAQPLATRTSDHEQISLVVPRRMLAARIGHPDGHHQQVIPARLPLVSLLRESLQSLCRHLDAMSPQEGEAAMRPLLDLAAAAINSRVAEDQTANVNLALVAAVRRHIEERLLDPALSLEAVMAAFGLSRRTLYRLLEPSGGFQTYVTECRLRRAHQALRAPAWRHVAIAEIAEAHGFPHPENFSRAFRRLFGLAPREARQWAALGRNLPGVPAGPTELHWSSWITAIAS
jgi:AraC-like DNA-binding protein